MLTPAAASSSFSSSSSSAGSSSSGRSASVTAWRPFALPGRCVLIDRPDPRPAAHLRPPCPSRPVQYRELMARMGHSSSAALRYQHVMAGRDAAIAAALDELIEAASTLAERVAASTEWHAGGTNRAIR
jgi:hypothetical protein